MKVKKKTTGIILAAREPKGVNISLLAERMNKSKSEVIQEALRQYYIANESICA
jgi:ribosome-binding protein aMBF1 (putative translation factor)